MKKRLSLRFGRHHEEKKLAFTEDISSTGLYIKTATVFPPGSHLEIETVLPDNHTVRLEGRVVWAKKVPPDMLRFAKKCGMGIVITKFHTGQSEYLRLVSST